MRAAAEVMARRKDEITDWLIHETGGTRAKADLEWSMVRSVLWEAAAMPHHVEGRIMPSGSPGKESRVYREAVGVVAVISHGIFPCSCPTGPSLRRWPWETRWCSSPRATPRSPAA